MILLDGFAAQMLISSLRVTGERRGDVVGGLRVSVMASIREWAGEGSTPKGLCTQRAGTAAMQMSCACAQVA